MTVRIVMLKNYMVCFTDNIKNRIDDDELSFDGDGISGAADCVFDVLAENEDEAKKQYLRMCAKRAYDRNEGIALIKRECAARVISRIVSGRVLELPREVLVNKQFSQMMVTVYDSLAMLTDKHAELCSKEVFHHIAETIDINDFTNLLDRNSVVALYVELYMKDVFVQELETI